MGRMAEAARESRRELKGMFDQLERGLRLFDQVEDAEVSRVGGDASFLPPPPPPGGGSGPVLGPNGRSPIFSSRDTNTPPDSRTITTSDDAVTAAGKIGWIWDSTRTVAYPRSYLETYGTPFTGPQSVGGRGPLASGKGLRGWRLGSLIFIDPVSVAEQTYASGNLRGGRSSGGAAASPAHQRGGSITPATGQTVAARHQQGQHGVDRGDGSTFGRSSAGSTAAGSTAASVDRMRRELGSKLDRVSTQLQGGGLASALRRAR